MRKILVFFLFFFAAMSASAGVHRVGCYNLRWPSNEDVDDKSWPQRQKAVYTMICDTMNFDVVALQEVTHANDINMYDSLKHYIGNKYTFYKNGAVVVAYRTSKYTRLDEGYFYLKPSPVPKDWEESETRRAVWAKLQDKTSGEIFVFTSTHLDLKCIAIREGARICAEKMREIAGNNACVITGDLNCEPDERDPHANFLQYFGDARDMCKTTPKGTYFTFASGMNPSASTKKRIDFIYVRNVEVESYWTNPSTLGRTLYPSDHLPTMCEITILPKVRATTHVVNNVQELRQAAREVQVDDVIHLNEGRYDLADSTLVVTNTCVIEGDDNVVLTGKALLLKGNSFNSFEIRNLHIQDATCDMGGYGSVAFMKGNYFRLNDCVMDGCTTKGEGLVYVKDCKLTVDGCRFSDNQSSYRSCGLVVTSDTSGYTFPLTVTNSTFQNNAAYHGSAIYYLSRYAAYIANNSFVGNKGNERGCILVDATNNVADLCLVNNTFVNNTVNVKSGRTDALVGGSVLWQNQGQKGYVTLVNNTMVGNYTACWTSTGQSSTRFVSGAIHSVAGQMKLYNNIIAGNFSSCAGRGDVSLTDPTKATGGYNVLSAKANTNYALATTDMAATSYAVSLQELVKMYGGEVEDSVYHAPLQYYGENQMVALSPQTVLYCRRNIAVVDAAARSAETIGSDILNTGSKTGTLTTDQIGTTRNANSVPGSMEAAQTPTSLPPTPYTLRRTPYTKIIINNQIYISYEEKLYTITGVPVRL